MGDWGGHWIFWWESKILCDRCERITGVREGWISAETSRVEASARLSDERIVLTFHRALLFLAVQLGVEVKTLP